MMSTSWLCFLFFQVLQKLGKADETRDAAFEEMVANFNKQMVSFLLFIWFKGLFTGLK